MRPTHVLMYVTAVLSISSASILVLLSGAVAPACAFWRLLIASIILLPFYLLRREGAIFRGGDHAVNYLFIIIAGISLGMHFTLWMDSLFRLPVIVSTTIVVTYPIYAYIFEILIFKIKFRYTDILGMLIAFAGILLYFHEALNIGIVDLLGVIESFVASILAAVYFFIGRFIRLRAGLFTYVVPTYIVGAATVVPYSIITNSNITNYPVITWIYFALLALIPMIGGHTIMNYLLKFYSSYVVSSIAFLEPVGASLLALLILNQVPRIEHIVATPLVLCGVALVLRSASES